MTLHCDKTCNIINGHCNLHDSDWYVHGMILSDEAFKAAADALEKDLYEKEKT